MMAPMPPMPMPPPSGNTPPMPMPMDSMPAMHAAFFWGHRVQVLFPNWPGDREHARMYVVSLFMVAALAALAEVLTAWSRALAGRGGAGSNALVWTLQLTWIHLLKMGLLYLVMLAAMSFNGGVFLAVVAGHAAGFLITQRWMLRPAVGDDDVRTDGGGVVPASTSEGPKP